MRYDSRFPGQQSMDFNDQMADLTDHPRYSRAFATPYKDGHLVTLPSVALPPGWDRAETDLVFLVKPYFCCGSLYGFWTKEDVRLEGGRLPQLTGPRCKHQDPFPEGYDKFWYYGPSRWSAVSDGLLTYAHFIRRRFATLR